MRFQSSLLTVLSLASGLAIAAPREPVRHGQDGHGGHGAPARQRQCVVASSYACSNGTADDSPAILRALADCAENAVVVFEPGVDYNVLTPVHATNLSNVEIRMLGNLHLPQDVAAVQKMVNDSNALTYSTALYWFKLEGPRIDYAGSADIEHGWIYSYGQRWWDANGVNKTGTPLRPHLLSFNTTHGSLRHFKSRKPIAWGVQLIGDSIEVSHTIVDAYSTGGFPFNTDGFDVTGTNIRISDSVIYNGDDAIAIQSGSHNVVFERNTIGYQSHGMSIGSLGQNQADFANVSNILFRDNTVISAVYAARFKSWMGGQGLAKNITWQNIRVYNVTFPIFVTQTYTNQGSKATQLQSGAVSGRPNNSSVMMEDFTFADFAGTINTFNPGDGSCVSDPCWYNNGLPDLAHTAAVIIECNTDQSCKNFAVSNIQVFPQSLADPTVICINATAALNPSLGFDCRNGTYAPFLP